MFSRNKVAMLLAEFLGAGVLTLVIVAVQRSTIGVPYFVGLAGGLAVALLMFVFGRISGAHLNPAITIGMWTARKITTVKALLFIAVQLLGGYLAGVLYSYLINNDLAAVGSQFTGRLLVAETVGAFVLSLGWAATVYNGWVAGTKSTITGLAYALGIIVAASASVGIVNPAVALGANAWAWGTYVLGPVLGALGGVNLYAWLFADGVRLLPARAARTTTASTASKTTAKKSSAKRKTTKRK
jgi:glycerol uptake facilitator-like aquaporin